MIFAVSLIGALLLDGLVRPRAGSGARLFGRSLAGAWLTTLMISALFGGFLAISGNAAVAAGLALALLALFVLASNAKNAMLGEPLLFSDLALIGSIFRHPKFYLSAITAAQRAAIILGTAVLLGCLAWLFVPALQARLNGLGVLIASLVALGITLRLPRFHRLVTAPRASADIQEHGLLPTLLLYWLRWRDSADPPPCAATLAGHPGKTAPELIVAIQCESFADPVEIFGKADLALPGLTFARENACQYGQLEVSGFGAYTMRTEYGVLFGRSEDELGFRRYDPFLTALSEASYALPNRLKAAGWRSLFLHPHDMRFYNRDRIMPASGFDELVGEEHFARPGPAEGQYVTDAAVADRILSCAKRADSPTLLYAVTIENHGPWAPDDGKTDNLLESYMRLARHSDAMLTRLLRELSDLQRSALLVFFGDHRPSIPGTTAPGGDRHTPYVILRLDETGQIVPGPHRRENLTPAALHHAILSLAAGDQWAGARNDRVSVTAD